MAKKQSKKVTTKQNTEMADATLTQYADFGFEDATKDDFLVPLVIILQSNSPQVLEGGQDYVEGAKPGLLYNNVTSEVAKEIEIVPVKRERVFIEWVPRDEGGGLVDTHTPDSDIVAESKPDDERPALLITPSGNHLVDTRRFYCLIKFPGQSHFTPAVLPFASTNIQVARRWYTIMSENTFTDDKGNTRVYPLFANHCTMTTRMRQNEKGNWYVYDPSITGFVQEKQIIDQAVKFAKALKEGTVQVKEEAAYENTEDTADF